MFARIIGVIALAGIVATVMMALGVPLSIPIDHVSRIQDQMNSSPQMRALTLGSAPIALGLTVYYMAKPRKRHAKYRPRRDSTGEGDEYGEVQGMFRMYAQEQIDTKITVDVNENLMTESERRMLAVVRKVCTGKEGGMKELPIKDCLHWPSAIVVIGATLISIEFNLREIWRRIFKTCRYGFDLPFFMDIGKKLNHQTTLVSVGKGVKDPTNYLDNAMRHNITVKIMEVEDDSRLLDNDDQEQQKYGLLIKGSCFTMYQLVLSKTGQFRWYNVHGSSMVYTLDQLEKSERLQSDLRYQLQSRPNVPRRYQFNYVPTTPTDEHKNSFALLKEASTVIAHLLPLKENVNDLPSHSNMSRFLAVKFLDSRNGLSYGFLATQMRTVIPKLVEIGENERPQPGSGMTFRMNGRKYFVDLPPVRVLASRSGCDKTKLTFEKDTIVLQRNPDGQLTVTTFTEDVAHIMPSFDTWVIMGHAVGNIILASVFRHLGRCEEYCRKVEEGQLIITHFHGFIQRSLVPRGVYFYGHDDPPLPCGCVKSPEIALRSKVEIAEMFMVDAQRTLPEFVADMHLEKDHGTMICGTRDIIEKLTTPELCRYGNFFFSGYEDLGV